MFDNPSLVSCAGLAPVLTLADRAGLHEHLNRHLMLAGPGAANAAVKATSLAARCDARTLAGLAARTPLVAGAAQVAYVDVDDTVKQPFRSRSSSSVRRASGESVRSEALDDVPGRGVTRPRVALRRA